MELIKLWTKVNISNIIVLPLINKILKNIKTRNNTNISIQGIFYEYGLLNSYLLNSLSKYTNNLRLVFDKKKLLESNLVDKLNTPLTSLLDIIVNSEYIESVKEYPNHIVIILKIDDKWSNDIRHIINSSYSLVTSEYKDAITYKGNYILQDDDAINYLYIKNIPAKIAGKHASLEKSIREIFNIDDKVILDELFPQFDVKKETFLLPKILKE